MCAKFTLVCQYMHDQETVHKMVTENIACIKVLEYTFYFSSKLFDKRQQKIKKNS
jgi:hypothetical protein